MKSDCVGILQQELNTIRNNATTAPRCPKQNFPVAKRETDKKKYQPSASLLFSRSRLLNYFDACLVSIKCCALTLGLTMALAHGLEVTLPRRYFNLVIVKCTSKNHSQLKECHSTVVILYENICPNFNNYHSLSVSVSVSWNYRGSELYLICSLPPLRALQTERFH